MHTYIHTYIQTNVEPGNDGRSRTIAQFVRGVIEDLHYYDTIFPRIPVPVQVYTPFSRAFLSPCRFTHHFPACSCALHMLAFDYHMHMWMFQGSCESCL